MFAKLATLLLPLALLAQFESNTLTGVVVAVHSGDTLTVRSGGQLLKVRLAHVYAPQPSQPFGPQAKQFLETLTLNRLVGLDIAMFDVYKRVIGEVRLADGRWVNDELVAAGMAWHYRVSQPPKEHLARLEHLAFTQKLGLWLQDRPMPPWEYTRERIIPPPPTNTHQVDYDRVFHYGLLGNPKNRTYTWPECRNYSREPFRGKLVFMSILDAEALGYRMARDCN